MDGHLFHLIEISAGQGQIENLQVYVVAEKLL